MLDARENASENEQLLRLSHVSKTFPGVKALSDISFELKRGEVHCLCGENGAGKSTLIKILSGAHQPDAGGEIFLRGKKVTLSPRDAMRMGIHTIYQEHIVFDHLDITENVFAGSEMSHWGIRQHRQMLERTAEVLAYLRTNLSPDQIVGSLTSGQKKLVEIAKALVFRTDVIILDEPTASFSAYEINSLLDVVRKLRDDGLGIIFISHHMDEVFDIGDRATVIRDGRRVSTYFLEGLEPNRLIRDMVGRDPSTFYQRERVPRGEKLLEVKHLAGSGVRDVSFDLHRGEIVGVAGMVGSGRSELMELLFGAAPAVAGEIRVKGRVVRHDSPQDAIRNGFCFITEDRQGSGLLLAKSIGENVSLAHMVNTSSPLALPSDEDNAGSKYIELLAIRAPGPRTKVMNLSGGNQQKVVLGKWFATDGEIFIFDEPSHGVDVGSKQEIYRVMIDLLKEGKAIIMVSSDMPEVIAMSDRVLVFRKGEVVGELMGEAIAEEEIIALSIGDRKQ